MKTLTVRLPKPLISEIKAESRERKCSKSDMIRERLRRADRPTQGEAAAFDAISDLIGSTFEVGER